MSVIVKGMEIPKDCWNCVVSSFGCCNVTGRIWDTLAKRPDWCPLVELPEKHGRLIDADAATIASLKRTGKRLLAIDTAPTVVEAEG